MRASTRASARVLLPARPDADHAIVGAGLSGLLLAEALLAESAAHGQSLRLLVVDPRPPDHAPATLAFWAQRPTPLDASMVGSWTSIRLVDHEGVQSRVGLAGWRYVAVDWGRERRARLRRLAEDPRVTVVQDVVTSTHDSGTRGVVVMGSGEATARWVYDSRPPSGPDLASDLGRLAPGGEPVLTQAFRGVWVCAEVPVVETDAATLLDFSTDEGPDLGFTYVLPSSPTSAMVMAVRMGTDPAEPDPLPAAERLLGTATWQVVAEERGATPLVARRPTRRLGRHVLSLGRRGGRVRPSTGYAVVRIIDDTSAIQRSLQREGHPFGIPRDQRWQVSLDTIWLRALAAEGACLEPAFLSLFRRAEAGSVLRFLDGQAGARDVAAVIRALPPRPFLRAASRRP